MRYSLRRTLRTFSATNFLSDAILLYLLDDYLDVHGVLVALGRPSVRPGDVAGNDPSPGRGDGDQHHVLRVESLVGSVGNGTLDDFEDGLSGLLGISSGSNALLVGLHDH